MLLVDDVVTAGNTLLACANRLWAGGHRGAILGAAVGWTAPVVRDALPDPFAPAVVVVGVGRGVLVRRL